jgi:hypothetical protein
MIERELYPGNKVSSEVDLKAWIERDSGNSKSIL